MENKNYKSIFKTTFIFGFIKLFNIITKVVLNKAIALILGPSGIGIIGVYQSILNIFKTFGGLGINQSSIKEISEAKFNESKEEYYEKILITQSISLYASIFITLLIVLFSKQISMLAFDSVNYKYEISILSIAILFTILTECNLSILKGAREIKKITRISIIGTLLGVLFTIPLYYFYEEKAIIGSFIVSSVCLYIPSLYYVGKIVKIKLIKFNKHYVNKSNRLIRMGFTLMITTLLGFIVDMITRSYILRLSGVDSVGVFQVGYTLVYGYFGIVLIALFTDYYPRISSINGDNNLLQIELNKQVKIGLVLICTLLFVFNTFSKDVIVLLYSLEFIGAYGFIKYAVFGILITLISNPLDLILIAKSEGKIFIIISFIYRLLSCIAHVIGYKTAGLKGLGISFIVSGLIHFLIMFFVNKIKYEIKITKDTWSMIIVVFLFSAIPLFLENYQNTKIKTNINILAFFASVYYSLLKLKNDMGIDVYRLIKKRK